ncbi:hypothetical protein [Actinomadura sp. NEAU-AAG7]|nr:hypothetical protein [Actinomadura sp. NEAU-AAG7]MBT2212567.1 hypothetical protein [Actinomadura sp. NEAU-AAG7]
MVEESLHVPGLPLLRRLLEQRSPLIEEKLLDPVEVITLDQAVRAFLS